MSSVNTSEAFIIHIQYLCDAGVHKFSKTLAATSKFLVPEG